MERERCEGLHWVYLAHLFFQRKRKRTESLPTEPQSHGAGVPEESCCQCSVGQPLSGDTRGEPRRRLSLGEMKGKKKVEKLTAGSRKKEPIKWMNFVEKNLCFCCCCCKVNRTFMSKWRNFPPWSFSGLFLRLPWKKELLEVSNFCIPAPQNRVLMVNNFSTEIRTRALNWIVTTTRPLGQLSQVTTNF